jgi:hypothetical protein
MIETRFQVHNANGIITNHDYSSLRDAVLGAARHDGWGAMYQRDEEGVMRLFSSKYHIGNNPYRPQKDDAFQAESLCQRDDEAETDVAEQILKSGVLHSRYSDLEIIKLTYDCGVLTHIDGRALAEVVAELDDGEIGMDTIRTWYGSK